MACFRRPQLQIPESQTFAFLAFDCPDFLQSICFPCFGDSKNVSSFAATSILIDGSARGQAGKHHQYRAGAGVQQGKPLLVGLPHLIPECQSSILFFLF